MITVREPAEQAVAATRLINVDQATQSLYSQQQFSFDKSAINSGSDLTYASNGTSRLKIMISGQGVMDLKNSALCFKYQPSATVAARAPIFAHNVASLFEVEQFQINTSSIVTGSSRSDIFNVMMSTFKSKDEKTNTWMGGNDVGENTIASAELALSGSTANSIQLKPLQQRAYEKLQSKRLLAAYRHFNFSGTTASAISAADRQMSHYYMVRLCDIIPAIASMDDALSTRFPLAFVQQIAIALRLQDPAINHVYAAHVWGDGATTTNDKSSIQYSISDVQLLRIESPFNGDLAKSEYSKLLAEGRISTTYTDFERLSYDVTNTSQLVMTLPIALRDLRFVALAFTLKDTLLSSYPAGAISSHDIFDTRFNYPWMSGLHFFQPKILDVFYQINGQSRFPTAQPQQALNSDIAPLFLRACTRQLIGDSRDYDQDYIEGLIGQNSIMVLPFQREAFSSQNLSLADQSNVMQITIKFASAQYQPSANFDLTNLQCHVYRVFDKQLNLAKNQALVI